MYAFERHGEHTVYIASADLMPRNLDHRVELAVPIEAQELRAELLDVLERCFADNQNSWDLGSDGNWARRAPAPGEEPRSLQQELAELYAARAATDRPSGEPRGQAPGARERTISPTAQPVAAAGSASSARLSSSTDW